MNLNRKIEVVVISNVFLDTDACDAKKLLTYLNSIYPKTIIFTGYFISKFCKSLHHLPEFNLRILEKIKLFAANGLSVIFTCNNLAIIETYFGKKNAIAISKHLTLYLDGKRILVLNQYNFNVENYVVKTLIKQNAFSLAWRVNKWFSSLLNSRQPILSEVQNINEDYAIYIATNEKVNGIISTDANLPKVVVNDVNNIALLYLNAGNWTTNFTALEYQFKRWKLYRYNKDKLVPFFTDLAVKQMDNTELKNLKVLKSS